MIAEARAPLARLGRSRRAWLPVVGWGALALVAAVVTRSGADHVIRGTFGFVALPLLAYGVVAGVLGGAGLKACVRPLVLLGANSGRAAAGAVAVGCIFSAFLCAALGAFVCFFAHRAGDPPLGADLVSTAGISAIGGAAYAAFFCAGSAIGKGTMRGVFLAMDWLMGSSGGFSAVLVPRGHVNALLGGGQVFEMSARASSVALVVLLVAYALFAVRWGRRSS